MLYLLTRTRNRLVAMLSVVLFFLLVIGLCDHLSVAYIKPFVARLRPSFDPETKDLLHYFHGYRGGHHGFVSAHAANGFGVFVFFSMLFRRRMLTIALLFWVLMVCYSRIYLGVHFPGDLLGGALLGMVAGYLSYRLYMYVMTRFWGYARQEYLIADFKRVDVAPLIYTLVFSFVALAIMAYALTFFDGWYK